MSFWNRSIYTAVVLGAAFTLSANAETADAAITTTTAAPTVQAIGEIDIRPSYDSMKGIFRTENSLELGAKITPQISLSYLQGMVTNIYDPTLSASESGLNSAIDVGFIRARVKGLYDNKEAGLGISYQMRAYLPTDEGSRTKGQNLAMRNYLTLTKEISETTSVSLSEIPILFVHSRTGANGSANQAFENRVYLTGSFKLASNLSLDLPIMFHQTKYRDFEAGAKNNDAWRFTVWTYPEMTLQVSEHNTIGLAYYSDNLVKSDLSELTLGEGLEKGTVQLSFAASL